MMKNTIIIALALIAVSPMLFCATDRLSVLRTKIQSQGHAVQELNRLTIEAYRTDSYANLQKRLNAASEELAYLRRQEEYLSHRSPSTQPFIFDTCSKPANAERMPPLQLPLSFTDTLAEIEARRQRALEQLEEDTRLSLAIIAAQRAATVTYDPRYRATTDMLNEHFDRAVDQADDNHEAEKAAIQARYLQEMRDLHQEI